MKKGTVELLKQVYSLIVTVVLIIILLKGPIYFRAIGEAKAEERYEYQIEILERNYELAVAQAQSASAREELAKQQKENADNSFEQWRSIAGDWQGKYLLVKDSLGSCQGMLGSCMKKGKQYAEKLWKLERKVAALEQTRCDLEAVNDKLRLQSISEKEEYKNMQELLSKISKQTSSAQKNSQGGYSSPKKINISHLVLCVVFILVVIVMIFRYSYYYSAKTNLTRKGAKVAHSQTMENSIPDKLENRISLDPSIFGEFE